MAHVVQGLQPLLFAVVLVRGVRVFRTRGQYIVVPAIKSRAHRQQTVQDGIGAIFSGLPGDGVFKIGGQFLQKCRVPLCTHAQRFRDQHLRACCDDVLHVLAVVRHVFQFLRGQALLPGGRGGRGGQRGVGSQGMVLVPRMNPQAGVDRGVVGKFQAVLRQGVEQFLDGRDGGCGWGRWWGWGGGCCCVLFLFGIFGGDDEIKEGHGGGLGGGQGFLSVVVVVVGEEIDERRGGRESCWEHCCLGG